MDKSSLGDRMKSYENVSRTFLMPKSYVCIRVDGRAFHSWTVGLDRPFDTGLFEDMDLTATYLCENIQNAKIGYVQSDEITIITSNFDSYESETFFGGNIQKISSIVASMATAKFNDLRKTRLNTIGIKRGPENLATFDCRCWNVPNQWEAYNTLIWRQQDAIRNSLSSVAQSLFSHKELHGKNQSMMHEMLHEKSINWATDYTDGQKNGRLIIRETFELTETNSDGENKQYIPRKRWISKGAWVFTSQDSKKILQYIPDYID